MRMTQQDIWYEMARRKLQFHRSEPWGQIKLWGLFRWSNVSRLLENGLLLTDMKKENSIIWVRPSKKAYQENIAPLLKRSLQELTTLAGW